ncbi:beta-ketoacyl-ACP synthase [Patiriisocius marinus]|uniref:3-oxoacyl-[acyl-carrier-protein] synthase 1 n=1 Tax=Patiriisocius marinus TaxID=1397112 RepID=A0A5J4J0I0_9FLAO|nr:beta-ketoacyl-[acyl-carrier-protein] synthase family protein [Patiriisocius marinus]GER59458.1 beta-ketoacyl-ACP synthase [Patiriisocius marinus]
MKNRVVITGMGVCAPNGVGLETFTEALKNGTSGITHHQLLKDLNFSCQIGGIPKISEEKKREYFTDLQLRNFNASGILYGIIAGMDALNDSGLSIANQEDEPNWDLGIVFGVATSGVEKFRESIYKLDEGKVRRLGSTAVAQTMTSGVSAYLTGMIGAGNSVTTNSSACATGTEAILMGYERIANGQATQMLCGSTGEDGPYIWGGFDAMKVISYKFNHNPESGSRPMDSDASGFVPGSGAGAMLLESLESAHARGAKIYAEILGGSVNSGGHRQGGSMTAPNATAVRKCISKALENSTIDASEIDYINGHLTATVKDPEEIKNWTIALKRKGENFPYINSLKSLTGHCLAASGSIESVATVLQMKHNFIFGNKNCENLHPSIASLISSDSVPTEKISATIKTAIKASFGFGDVNACIIFRKY